MGVNTNTNKLILVDNNHDGGKARKTGKWERIESYSLVFFVASKRSVFAESSKKEVRLSVGFESNIYVEYRNKNTDTIRSKLNEYYPMNVLNEYELTTASVIVIDNTKKGKLKQVCCVRMMTRRMFSFSIVLYGGLAGLFLSWVWIMICIDSPFFASYSL